MIETLIELCENEVPVNLKSLCNTLNEEIDKHYINYSPFKSEVNGGYIVVKKDGDVVAYHSCIADEFKNFLMEKYII